MKKNLKDLKNLPPKENIIFNNSKGEMLTDLTIKIENGEMLVFEKGATTPAFILNNYKNINFHVDEKTMLNVKENKNLEDEIKENFVLKDDSHFTYVDGTNEVNFLNKSNVDAANVLAEEVSTTSDLTQTASLTTAQNYFGISPFWILGGFGLAAAGFGVSKMGKKAKDDDAKYKIDNNFNNNDNEAEIETTPINKENKKPEETKPTNPIKNEIEDNSSTSPEENNSQAETPTQPSPPENGNTNTEEPNPNLSENEVTTPHFSYFNFGETNYVENTDYPALNKEEFENNEKIRVVLDHLTVGKVYKVQAFKNGELIGESENKTFTANSNENPEDLKQKSISLKIDTTKLNKPNDGDENGVDETITFKLLEVAENGDTIEHQSYDRTLKIDLHIREIEESDIDILNLNSNGFLEKDKNGEFSIKLKVNNVNKNDMLFLDKVEVIDFERKVKFFEKTSQVNEKEINEDGSRIIDISLKDAKDYIGDRVLNDVLVKFTLKTKDLAGNTSTKLIGGDIKIDASNHITESNGEENSTETQPPIVEPIRKIELLSINDNTILRKGNGYSEEIVFKYKVEDFKEGDVVELKLGAVENNSYSFTHEGKNGDLNGIFEKRILVDYNDNYYGCNDTPGSASGDCYITPKHEMSYFSTKGDYTIKGNITNGNETVEVDSNSIYIDYANEGKGLLTDYAKLKNENYVSGHEYIKGNENNNNFKMLTNIIVHGKEGNDNFIFDGLKEGNTSRESYITDFESGDKILITNNFLGLNNILDFNKQNLFIKKEEVIENHFNNPKEIYSLNYTKSDGGEENIGYLSFADGFTISNDDLSNYVSII